jgi:hypothetical protein
VLTEVTSVPDVETIAIGNPPVADPKSEISAPQHTYVTEETQLVDVVRDLARSGAIALDIETYYPDARITRKANE